MRYPRPCTFVQHTKQETTKPMKKKDQIIQLLLEARQWEVERQTLTAQLQAVRGRSIEREKECESLRNELLNLKLSMADKEHDEKHGTKTVWHTHKEDV